MKTDKENNLEGMAGLLIFGVVRGKGNENNPSEIINAKLFHLFPVLGTYVLLRFKLL